MIHEPLKAAARGDAASPAAPMDEAIPVEEKRRERRRRLLIATAVAAALASVLAFLLLRTETAYSRASMSIAAAERGVFRETTSVLAGVEPAVKVVLASDIGGQVERIFVRAGTRVAAGSPIYHLSNPQLELDVLQRQTEVTQQVSNLYTIEQTYQQRELELERLLAQASSDRDAAVKDQRRIAALHGRGFISEARMEQADRDVRRTDSEHRSVQANHARFLRVRSAQTRELGDAVRGLRQSLVVAQQSKDRLLIGSPIAGILTEVGVEVGQFASPGQSIGTVADDRALKLVAQVDQFFLGRVREGLPAEATLSGAVVPLTVTKVLPNVSAGKFQVELSAPAVQGRIRLGQNVPVRILLSRPERSVTIPLGPYLQETSGRWVFVLAADGATAERRPVRLGARNDNQIVVEDGLAPGERVIVSSYRDFEQHDRLRLR
ncbi:MAG TPA: HlyD family efflux transporter periplasmic adaptor subunit [Allosphingosinicella sp.]|nr:HlyD family efflux transporter periplasmic adaptor subunit [Allosphingosinicella sp.]